MRKLVLLALLAGGCAADPGYDVVRTRVPDDLPRARVLIPDGGRPLMIVDDRLTGACYQAAIEHEKKHIADTGWRHNEAPFVCRNTIDSLTASYLADVPPPMPSRSKGGTRKWFPKICDPPVNGGPPTAYCRSQQL
jgi:hypothetical protein